MATGTDRVSVGWRVVTVVAILLFMVTAGTCAGAIMWLKAQQPRKLVVVLSQFVVRAEDSLATVSGAEHRERAGCLLGFFAGSADTDSSARDSLIVPSLWEPPYTDSLRTIAGVVFGCPRGITVGTWHTHVSPFDPPLPVPPDWCRPSPLDSVTDRWYVRHGVHLFHISVPGVGRCAWWMSPDGRITRLPQS